MWEFQKEAVGSFVLTDFMSNFYLILVQKMLNLHNTIVRNTYFLCVFSESQILI